MLRLTVPLTPESWDEVKNEFVPAVEVTVELEHSLVSLSKWESKWNKAFLTKSEKTFEETIDYIKCMTLTENVDPKVYDRLTWQNVDQINKYIEAPMTATTFSADKSGKTNREVVTAELIYYWMIALGVPFECQNWHLNRLLTLIRVCNVKNQPNKNKKMSKRDILSHNAALNAARRKQFNTKG